MLYFIRDDETELEVSGYVETGGSNAYGSDDPAWTEVHVQEIRYVDTGALVSKEVMDTLTKEEWESIEQLIYDDCAID